MKTACRLEPSCWLPPGCLFLFGLLTSWIYTAPAHAQDRVLRAVPEADGLVAKARTNATVAAAHAECTSNTVRSRTPEGYLCRVRILVAEAGGIAIAATPAPRTNSALKRRAALAAAACKLGSALADYQPVNAVAGLDKLRFETKALGCRAVGSLYDALLALPPGSPAAAAIEGDKALPACWAGKPLKDVVCGCGSEAAQLGAAAFVAPDDALLIETNRALYSRGCFLDVKAGGTSLVDLHRAAPSSGPASSAPGGGDDRTAAVRQYARSHEFQIKHCVERSGGRRPTDTGKLESCLCEAAGKWRVPKSSAGASGVEIAIGDGAYRYRLDVDLNGQVSECRLLGIDRERPTSQSAPGK